VKFKLDENMPAGLTAMLEEQGHDVADVVGEGLTGEDDDLVLRASVKEDRILVTFDLDFADIRHYPPGTHPGIVVFRLRDQRWNTLEGLARHCLMERNLEKLEKGLAIVDETRIRYKRPRRKDSS
jgi:predicted nuclease of predicted toxin-antitoxin system